MDQGRKDVNMSFINSYNNLTRRSAESRVEIVRLSVTKHSELVVGQGRRSGVLPPPLSTTSAFSVKYFP